MEKVQRQIQIPPGSSLSVSCECYVFSATGRFLVHRIFTNSEVSLRVMAAATDGVKRASPKPNGRIGTAKYHLKFI
jgi:hypothetical protein